LLYSRANEGSKRPASSPDGTRQGRGRDRLRIRFSQSLPCGATSHRGMMMASVYLRDEVCIVRTLSWETHGIPSSKEAPLWKWSVVSGLGSMKS
jgi:hypothetical protein